MPHVGVSVTATENPLVTNVPYNTANAFFVGLSDWGPTGSAVQLLSMNDVNAQLGVSGGANARTATNATLYDALNAYFEEGGSSAFVSRVVGPGAVAASLALSDSTTGTAATLNAQYVGAGGNAINVVVNNAGANYTVTLQDVNGNVLATSPTLSATNKSDLITWAATTGLVTATAGNANLPKTIAATPMTNGNDQRGSATITNWTTALNNFPARLGPGQVLAPGQTNTTLPGIWSALGTHGQTYNRVAICNMNDGETASQLTTDFGTFGASNVASYCGFWAANLVIPGLVPGTTRTVSPDCVVAALCAQVDGTGNPNRAAAGARFPLSYVTSISSAGVQPFTMADRDTLNGVGINTFANVFGVLENYGFVAAVPSTTDSIYWQFNHARLRMALTAEAQIVGEPFVFSQIDGSGMDTLAFGSALQAMLQSYWAVGALFGNTANDAFSVNVGPNVNTPATASAGQLIAQCQVRMSPFAQTVPITLNAIPTTQTLSTAGSK